MKKNRIIDILKWVWLAVVLLGAGWYIVKNFSSIWEFIKNFRPGKLGISLVLVMLGKFLTADLTYRSLKLVQHDITYKQAFSIATVTQLGKYLPGGIWHFAGKFGVYKSRGMSSRDAALPMILENVWLFSSAFIIGFTTIMLANNSIICRYFPFICDPVIKYLIPLGLIIIWMLALIFLPGLIFKTRANFLADLCIILEQILVWLLFGISLWIIFPDGSTSNYQFILLSIGSFSISWLAGYAAFFAPGGIGIREAVLTLLLGSLLSGEMIAVYAAVHRLLWVLVEILLGLGSALLFGMPFSKDTINNSTREDQI